MTTDRELTSGVSRGWSRAVAIAALLFVYVLVRVFWSLDEEYWRVLTAAATGGWFKIAIWVVPSVLAVALLRRISPRAALGALGLDAAIGPGLVFGLVTTLPLALAVALGPHHLVGRTALLNTALLGPLAEEVLFRGFLFRTLYQQARWPLGWAVLASAVAFGAAHVSHLDVLILNTVWFDAHLHPYVVGDFYAALMQVAMMTTGGAVFAWVVHRRGSLWPAIALHGSVNLWLTVAEGDGATALRFDTVGVAQVLALVLAVAFTFRQRPAAPVASPAPLS